MHISILWRLCRYNSLQQIEQHVESTSEATGQVELDVHHAPDLLSGKWAAIHLSISTEHPYRKRSSANGQIRFGETSRGESDLVSASIKHRAAHWHNAVLASIRTGTQATVRMWVKQNVQLDMGLARTGQMMMFLMLLASLFSCLHSLYWWEKSFMLNLYSVEYTYLPEIIIMQMLVIWATI